MVFGLRAPVSMPLALHAGWNWVGYLPAASHAIEDALQSIAGRYQQVRTLDQVYLSDQPGASDLDAMGPDEGYFIFMDEGGTLIYPEDPPAE